MAKVEANVIIDRPVQDVWKFITDLSTSNAVDPHILDAKQTSAGPFGVGTTVHLTRSNFPKNLDIRITEYEPNRKWSVVMTSGPVKGTTEQQWLEMVEGKTKLTYSFDPKGSGLGRLLVPFMTGSVRRTVESDLSNTKRILESEAKF